MRGKPEQYGAWAKAKEWWGNVGTVTQPEPIPRRQPKPVIPPVPSAVFTPVGEAAFPPVAEATFELTDPATFEPESAEGWTASDLDDLFTGSDEDRFLSGEVKYVQSSNVAWFQWLGFYEGTGQVRDQLYVGFLDGSVYEYDGVNLSEALLFFRTDSPGRTVWRELRILGTTFGYRKPYRLVSGYRLWNTTSASAARHESIPAYGEPKMPVGTYHPLTNWASAPGKMGAANISLSKKKGSRKVAHFVGKGANVW